MEAPYADIQLGEWKTYQFDSRLYVPAAKNPIKALIQYVHPYKYDVFYFNSFFSLKFSIIPILMLKFGRIDCQRVVVAPRGEFNKGALGIKPLKKILFIAFSKILGLHKKVIWQATNELEKKQIQDIFGGSSKVSVASNLPKNTFDQDGFNVKSIKKKNILKLLFVGRVSEIKNIDFALSCLKELHGSVQYDVYGPKEDEQYWNKCKDIANQLPSNVKVSFKGPIENSSLISVYPYYHFFISPTKGENFGHSIFEALSHRLPVIISDKTPWRDLTSYSIGWDLTIESTESFKSILTYCLEMENEEYQSMVENTIAFVAEYRADSKDVSATRDLFKNSPENRF
jgi:glycosyltransferase involved in cell wall biosynthesis